jgi:hypothetical protein
MTQSAELTAQEIADALEPALGRGWVWTVARALGVDPKLTLGWERAGRQGKALRVGSPAMRGELVAALRRIAGELADAAGRIERTHLPANRAEASARPEPGGPATAMDEWIVGDGARDLDGARAEYLVHTVAPRFVCRVVDESGEEPEAPYDSLSGLSYAQGDDFTLCMFVWIDPPPPRPQLDRLLEAACDAVEQAAA